MQKKLCSYEFGWLVVFGTKKGGTKVWAMSRERNCFIFLSNTKMYQDFFLVGWWCSSKKKAGTKVWAMSRERKCFVFFWLVVVGSKKEDVQKYGQCCVNANVLFS